MIGIIDTESQNLGSIENCLKFLKIKYRIITNPEQANNCNKIILPGVGSFDSVMSALGKKKFTNKNLQEILSTKKVLAICVGLQILFSNSEEGIKPGIDFFKGKIKKLSSIKCKEPIPHVGYNSISLKNKEKYLSKIFEKDFYFTHSYVVEKKSLEKNFNGNYGLTRYGDTEFLSFIKHRNIFATQFHPEKSGEAGLNLLKYFYEEKKNNI
tara:strand:- start:2652 stop:3284 length:633 start_codon:yes stop_codon:yes gene_type:complete